MPEYPVDLDVFTDRVSNFGYLIQHSDVQFAAALDTARAEVELYCPAAAAGALDTRLDRAAGTIQSDLALYYLRLEIERDPETGAPPKSLDVLRSEIMERLRKLGEQAEAQPYTTYAMEAFAPLATPQYPDGVTSRGSSAASEAVW